MSAFDDLLKSLNEVGDEADALAKKRPPKDDKAVAKAAGDDMDDEEDDIDEDDEDGQEFGKSMGFDADGNELVDATNLFKSLLTRQGGTETALAQALTTVTGVVSTQNRLIKSLSDKVDALGGQGRGRKTMLSISEKPGLGDMTKSAAGEGAEDGKITQADLLAKSNAAYAAGKLSGVELNTIDVCLRSGWSIDPGILRKVAAA